MKRRNYTDKEISLGGKVQDMLSEQVQHHHGACSCALCKAWMALCPVGRVVGDKANDLYPNAVREEE